LASRYYIYMTDQVAGGEHFRTTVQKGLEIIQALRGWTSELRRIVPAAPPPVLADLLLISNGRFQKWSSRAPARQNRDAVLSTLAGTSGRFAGSTRAFTMEPL